MVITQDHAFGLYIRLNHELNLVFYFNIAGICSQHTRPNTIYLKQFFWCGKSTILSPVFNNSPRLGQANTKQFL